MLAEWRAKNAGRVLDYSRSYYAAHREKCIERAKQYSGSDKAVAKRKEVYLKHKEVMLQRTREWRVNSPSEYLLSGARQRARRGQLSIDIDASDIAIPEVCPVLGIRLAPLAGKRTDATPSLDRIDPSKGYVKGNVWVISWRANRLKSDSTLDELRAIVSGLEKAERLQRLRRFRVVE